MTQISNSGHLFIHATLRQKQETRKMGQILEDRKVIFPVYSIASLKQSSQDEFLLFLKKDVSLKDVSGSDNYNVFATRKDLGL